MNNVILAEPSTLALLGLGFFLLCFGVVAVLGTVAVMTIFLTRKARNQSAATTQPTPSTQVAPKNCPKCAAPMPADSPEGLCPRCLIALNLATQTDIPGEAGAPKVPPGPPLPVSDIAKLFPQLEILECLGRGGMGAVYKVRQPRLDRVVALKILSPEKQGNQKFADRFEREARALAKLHHLNIVSVFDFGEVEGNYYLLMEFVDGLSLRQLLQQRKLSPPEALAIVPKICEALQYAHEQGIVHRDIKPENILMDKEGRVKIADFGIAKILGDSGSSNLTAEQVIGTPHYMSPEQIEKPQAVDHRADIYSLGVVFYEMLTGELPLGKFPPPSKKVQVDVRLDEIVLRALEKEPERRYQQASEVKSQVETVAATASDGRSARKEAQVENESILTQATAKLPMAILGIAILVLAWMAGILFLASTSGRSDYIGYQLLPFLVFIFLPGMIGYFIWRLIKSRTGRTRDRGFRIAILLLTVLFTISLLTFFVSRSSYHKYMRNVVEVVPVPAPQQPTGGNEDQTQSDSNIADEQPPVVVETFPVSGARDVPPGDTEIRVRYSKDMMDGSWSWSTAWENSTPVSIGPPHYIDDHRTCIIKVRLEPGKTYAWWLNSDKFKNFTDTNGQPAVPFLFSFQTKTN